MDSAISQLWAKSVSSTIGNIGLMHYVQRKTARVVLFTPQHEVLLIRMTLPWEKSNTWVLPGGGIEADEDAQFAARREVHEETGIAGITLDREIWFRNTDIQAIRTHLFERIFLCYIDRFDPKPLGLSEQEKEWIHEYRWWAVSDIAATDETIEPFQLSQGLKNIIKFGAPHKPIKIDPFSTC